MQLECCHVLAFLDSSFFPKAASIDYAQLINDATASHKRRTEAMFCDEEYLIVVSHANGSAKASSLPKAHRNASL